MDSLVWILRSRHLRFCLTFEKLKTLAQRFVFFSSLATPRVFGLQYPNTESIWNFLNSQTLSKVDTSLKRTIDTFQVEKYSRYLPGRTGNGRSRIMKFQNVVSIIGRDVRIRKVSVKRKFTAVGIVGIQLASVAD